MMNPVHIKLDEARIAQALSRHYSDMGDYESAREADKAMSDSLDAAKKLADEAGCDFDIDVVLL